MIYFNEADRDGHFAMWEHPELFSGRAPGGVQILTVVQRQAVDDDQAVTFIQSCDCSKA
jgi:hypothetical protein